MDARFDRIEEEIAEWREDVISGLALRTAALAAGISSEEIVAWMADDLMRDFFDKAFDKG